MKIEVVQGDITNLEADAIVNAANIHMQMGGGVCGAIYRAAGSALLSGHIESVYGEQLPVMVGQVIDTPSFNLYPQVDRILHVAGPVWYEDNSKTCEYMLFRTYVNVLNYASKRRIKSIAIPCISTGIYGFPMGDALQCVEDALEVTNYDGKITFVCFTSEDYESYRNHFGYALNGRKPVSRLFCLCRDWVRDMWSRLSGPVGRD